jgi:putative aldouronate transport system substrate-binding protein
VINDIIGKYPKLDEIRPLIDWNLYRDSTERAYFAKSDEEALKIVNDFREQLKKGGIEEFEQWVTEEMKKHPDYIY